jgi:probable rRNA maturation factor
VSPKLSLTVQYAVESDDLPTRPQLRRWARAALERDCTVTLRFLDADEGRALNASFRGKDYATNVLTFTYGESDPLEGDIALCVPVVVGEAQTQGKPTEAHWAHLVVHGMLHLQGHDHEDDAEAREMEARETQILGRLGYPDPYLPAA